MYEVSFPNINSGNISFFLTWCASYFCSNLFLLKGDGGKLLKQLKFLNPLLISTCSQVLAALPR